jgi:hypothetical protein
MQLLQVSCTILGNTAGSLLLEVVANPVLRQTPIQGVDHVFP